MKSKYFATIFTGFVLGSTLSGAEPIFQGFGKPWEFPSGVTLSESRETVSIPVLPGGMYFGIRQTLAEGIYVCSFEYKFHDKAPSNARFSFNWSSTPSVNVDLTPHQEWTAVKFRLANTKSEQVKLSLGVIFSQNNLLELKNFRIEKLVDDDFDRLEYPISRDFWFNRGDDRRNTVLSTAEADDHVSGGRMIQLKAKPEFKPDGLFCLMSLVEPLPLAGKFRLSFWSKSDQPGTIRVAVSNQYHTYRVGPEWQKTSFEFLRKANAQLTSNVSFQTLSKEIRTLMVKDVVIERVKE